MAVLEKLRKRPKLLMGIIGGALLLFILTIIDNPAAILRPNETMALQVGDEKIDIQQFSGEQERIQKQNPNQKTDGDVMQQQIVQKLIGERLIAQECKDAGIDVSNDEILTVLLKETGWDKQIFEQVKNANPNPNSQDPQQQQLYEAKVYCESRIPEIANSLKSSKLEHALMGCIKPNKLDEELIKEEQTPYEIEYTKVDYAQFANNYKVSDEEIKEAYEQFKECFKIDQEQRRISYIKVDLDPSAEDTKAANANIAKIYNAFSAQSGVLGIRNNKDTHLFIDSLVANSKTEKLTVATSGATEPKDPIYTELLAGGLNSMKMRTPTNPRDRNTYIYKVTKIVECPDSIGLNYVQVKGNKQMLDSVFALLTSGTISLDSLERSNKNQNIAIQKFNPANMPPAEAYIYQDSIREKIMAHLDGGFFLFDSQPQDKETVAVYAQVAQHKAPVTLYSIARARYENDPSDNTVDNLTKKLQAYINKNKTAADFKKNAKAAKYDVQECVVDANNPYIGGQMTGPVVGTRDLIKWAFDNKPGAVSDITRNDDNGYIVAAAVEDVYNDYKPYTDPDVKQHLTTYLLNKKIGEDMFKKYNGKANDMAGYAQLLNSTVDSTSYVPGAPQIINDAKVAGRIIGLGKNAVGKIQVIAGDNALYVVKVNQQGTPRPLPKQEIAATFPRKMNVNPYNILVGSRKIFNNTLKFVR